VGDQIDHAALLSSTRVSIKPGWLGETHPKETESNHKLLLLGHGALVPENRGRGDGVIPRDAGGERQ
jgi:hypothetical protein